MSVVVEHRSTHVLIRAVNGTAVRRVNGTGKESHAVGVCRGNDGLVVHVTNRERVSQVPLHRNIIFLKVTETVDRVPQGPVVIVTIVPGGMVKDPVVHTCKHTLGLLVPIFAGPVEIEGLDFVHILGRGRTQNRLVHRLVEHTLARVVRDLHVRVLEATHTCHCAKVVVEGTVLLHEEYNVLHLLQAIVDTMGFVPLLFSERWCGDKQCSHERSGALYKLHGDGVARRHFLFHFKACHFIFLAKIYGNAFLIKSTCRDWRA